MSSYTVLVPPVCLLKKYLQPTRLSRSTINQSVVKFLRCTVSSTRLNFSSESWSEWGFLEETSRKKTSVLSGSKWNAVWTWLQSSQATSCLDVIMGHSQLFNVCGWLCASLSPQLLPCLFWLIGLISRIKKQCFRLIRKIPFIGATVSISSESVPFFPSRCALTLLPGALMSHSQMTE